VGGIRMATMKNKTIAFNIDNPEDEQIYNYIKDITNFSAFAKSLINQDMQKPIAIKVIGKKL
jgi:hypothetical protein